MKKELLSFLKSARAYGVRISVDQHVTHEELEANNPHVHKYIMPLLPSAKVTITFNCSDEDAADIAYVVSELTN